MIVSLETVISKVGKLFFLAKTRTINEKNIVLQSLLRNSILYYSNITDSIIRIVVNFNIISGLVYIRRFL